MDIIVVWLFNVRGKEFPKPRILLTSFVLSLVVFTLTATIDNPHIKYASCQDPHHIFPLSFLNLLDVILCPNLFRHLLFTHAGSASAQGTNRWISDGEYIFCPIFTRDFPASLALLCYVSLLNLCPRIWTHQIISSLFMWLVVANDRSDGEK